MNSLRELLEGSRAFDIFVNILCTIPHASGNEKLIIKTIALWAEANGFESRGDKVGNLGVFVPGRGKYSGSQKAILCQGHVDMVPKVANDDIDFDFAKDPIVARLVGNDLYATGTTLGADNGLGVAVMMAAAENPNFECPSLVLLFTVREETDMGGAKGLNPWITFNDQIELVGGFNLDSEEGVEEVYIGCAGGSKIVSKQRNSAQSLTMEDLEPGLTGFKVTVRGLSGGHSGLEIDKCHQNAIRVMSAYLQAMAGEYFLTDGEGGSKQNSIPTECWIRGLVDCEKFIQMEAELNKFRQFMQSQLVPADAGFEIFLEEVPLMHLPNTVWPADCSRSLLDFIYFAPDGLISTDQIVDYKLPRTSSNLGVFKLSPQVAELTFLVRSSVNGERDLTVDRICNLGGCLYFISMVEEAFPAWQPDAQNPILLAAENIWPQAFNCQPRRMVTHGGLECGELGRILGGLPMISLGGKIIRAHETDEHADVPSWLAVEKGFKVLLQSLPQYFEF